MVKLPAFLQKKKSINLLPRDSFEASTVGVLLTWALSFGKWAVILTQLIVMATFLWRFGLDRKLTNLNRAILQEVSVIKSYENLESEFRLTQKSIVEAKTILERQVEVLGLIKKIQELTPPDVWYERISLSSTSITVTAYSTSLNGFSRYLAALQQEPKFLKVNVASIEDGRGQGAQLSFNITLTYAIDKGKK